MFVRFTQEPEGLPIYVRTARVLAFARTVEGGTRIFLGSGLNCLVAEDEDHVRRTLAGGDPASSDQA
ncbi:hypothetical protein D3C80_127320 [compost metagenome]